MLKRIVSGSASVMVRRKIIPLCILLLLALILPLAACATPTSTPTPMSVSSAPAVFQVDELAIDPAVAKPGEGIIVTAQVTNTGETEGSYTVELRINDIAEVVKKVTIPAGETYTLRFLEAKTIPGTYSVSLAKLTGQFVVVEPTELVQVEDSETIETESNVPSCCGGGSDSTEPEPNTSSGCGCGGSSSYTEPEPNTSSGCGCGGS